MVNLLLEFHPKQTLIENTTLIRWKVQGFGQHGDGVPDTDFHKHCFLVFDLASTQQASHEFLYTKLRNGSISIRSGFLAHLKKSVEVFA